MRFLELGLSSALCETLAHIGYTQPTAVQEQTIPYALRGQDILACAQTGTGKTASFLLPLIEMLSSSRGKARLPRAIILEPTRELATQVMENFKMYTKDVPLSAALLVGGESLTEQQRWLNRGVDILIATPGRLLDFIERGKILLADVKHAVIDEADRMLDMGFIPDINKLMGLLPLNRQALLFSATLPPEIKRLADTYLVNPKRISVTPQTKTAATIEQHQIAAQPLQKREVVRYLLKEYGKDIPSIIFCNRKRDVGVLVSSLKRHGFKTAALHGDLSQAVRNQALDEFRQDTINVLVASDVAARGLDIDKLGLVINYDVPINAEDYVHRIGRTGRAGQAGKAFTLVSKAEGKLWQAVENYIQQKIPLYSLKQEIEVVKAKAEPKPPVREKKRVDFTLPIAAIEEKEIMGFGNFMPAFMKITLPALS